MGVAGVSAHDPGREIFLLLFFKKEALANPSPQKNP
jgi:hypothetical protein